MLRLFRSRKTSAVALLLVAILFLIEAVSTTVKLNSEIIDYHAITEENAKPRMLCQGSIDEWYGPFAYTEDGAEIYFMLLDNGKLISFKTYNDEQKSIFLSYDENSTENKQVEFLGELEKTPSHDRYVLLGILKDEGFSVSDAEETLLPYYVKNINPGTNKYMYMISVVLGGIGILLLLPEFSSLIGKKSVKGVDYKPTNYSTASSDGYQGTYTGAYKSYTGTQNNTYGGSSAQQYGQSSAQGQNREYTGSNYTGQSSDTQGQNREYTGTNYAGQYSNTQGQNREYTGTNYTGQYSNTQGQNREYTGTNYAGQYSNTQGQNRDYTSDKSDDSTQAWSDFGSENKGSEF